MSKRATIAKEKGMPKKPIDSFTLSVFHHIEVAGRYGLQRSRLEWATGRSDRTNREAIAELRVAGYPVGEHGGSPGGYFVAEKASDLDGTIARMESRTRSMAMVLGGMRKTRRKLGHGEPQEQMELIGE